MSRTIFMMLLTWAIALSGAYAADVGFNLDLHVGNRAPVVPVQVPPPLVINEPPEFIMPPALGIYVAVGVPFDMVLISNQYYLLKGDVWYRAHNYNGPWVVAPFRTLPPGLRKHRLDRVRYYRDREYRRFHADRGEYRGRHFRPEKAQKEQRKAEHVLWKDERKHRNKGQNGRGHGE